MDGQKDIRPSDNISDFFERPNLRAGLFLNRSADRLYRRAERIVAGVFLVTNHIAPSEILRTSSRTAATRLLENVLSLRDEMRAPRSAAASSFRASARYLISLLRLLAISGFLSTQNSVVLIEALDELGNFLVTAQNSALSETVSFSRQDFLDVGTATLKDIKDVRSIKDKERVKDNAKMSDTATKRALNVRKQGILEVLRTGEELGINDISSNLPEYSTKMIQRDLAELVGLGQVKKAGLKRWSRYSLAG